MTQASGKIPQISVVLGPAAGGAAYGPALPEGVAGACWGRSLLWLNGNQLVRRQREWLLPTSGPTTALWWIRDGERPTPGKALARLRHLRTHGPTPRAFSVGRRFAPNGRPVVR